MELIQEIESLSIDFLKINCFGCCHECPSQRDHTCMDEYYYNLALDEAIDLVNRKYKIDIDRNWYNENKSNNK